MLEYFKKIIIIAVILFFHLSGASIKGIIRDKDSHAPLIGANVFLNETSQGSATDFDGFYVIENIKFCSNCKYTLKALYIGYEEYTATIDVNEDTEIVEDLILAAINQVYKNIDDKIGDKMKGITGGMNIPGIL